MNKLLLATCVLVIAAVAGLASFSRNGIWEREIGTELVWSREEAYFFASRQREGWSGTYLNFTWEALRYYVGGRPGNRTDREQWLEVTRVTGQGTKQVIVPDIYAYPMGVFENHVYLSANGKMVKWTNDQLIPVSSDEQARFNSDHGKGAGEFRDLNGWSREINIARGNPGENSYTMILGGVSVAVLTSQDPKRRVVSVAFPDGHVTALLDIRTDYVVVDEASYRSAFASTPRQ